jgi:protein SCO1/2
VEIRSRAWIGWRLHKTRSQECERCTQECVRHGWWRGLVLGAVVTALCAPFLAGQPGTPMAFKKIGIDQRLNNQMPLETILQDEDGRTVRFGQFFSGDRPVVLALVYYACPMLCNMTLNGLSDAMEKMPLDLGTDYQVVTVSFDDRETAPLAKMKKENYVKKYNRPGAAEGWHFLTGNAVAVRKIAEAAGFHYVWDSMTNQFAHAAGIMVLTPQGKVSKYFYGIKYEPRDLRLGLVDASDRKIGSAVDKILLYCYHYDPATGKYGLVVMSIVRLSAAATVLTLGMFMLIWLRRDRRAS